MTEVGHEKITVDANFVILYCFRSSFVLLPYSRESLGHDL